MTDQDRHSFMSQHVTVGVQLRILGWTATIIAAASTVTLIIRPPHLSAEDTKHIAEATVAVDNSKSAAQDMARAVLSLQSEVRCERVEIRAGLDANDRSIPNSYRSDLPHEQRRTSYRHDEIVKALKSQACPEDLKFMDAKE